jgi:hypothetical protein
MSPEDPNHNPYKANAKSGIPAKDGSRSATHGHLPNELFLGTDPSDTHAFLLEQLADGELTPEETLELESHLSSIPGADQHITFSRDLRAACVGAMSDVPMDASCRDRVRDAVRLRLRGEADALAAQAGLATAEPEQHKSFQFSKFRFIRLATAAALILAGFVGARFTHEISEARNFASGATASMGYDLTSKALRSSYLQGAIGHASSFLGSDIKLPEDSRITPIRYVPGSASEELRSVVFVFVVSYADASADDGMAKVPVTMIVQQDHQVDFDPGIVIEQGQGEVLWRTRQRNKLMYNIQSESTRALEIMSDSMGWPKPLSH